MRRFHTLIWAMTVAALVVALAPAALAEGNCCPDLGEGQLAELDQGRTTLLWRVFAEHARVRLTVSTPCGVFDRVYDKGEDPFFDIGELEPDDPNGSYTWQIRIDPIVDPAVAKALKEARNSGNDEIVKELRRKGLLPAGPFVQSGAFSVVDGAIVDPNVGGEKEGSTVSRVSSEDTAVEFSTDGNVRRVTAADQVIPDDLIVQGSMCVGFDCVNGETFNADTIRMKENNLRIHVDDTSTIAGFPNQDWRLEFNSQNSGGGEYFRVIDATASRNIMTLEANAPSNSLVVDDGGRVGLGTANPVLELHIANGDTPAIRLEQTTGSGFAAQTWDIAGNETNFFVRDVTGGSTLPFRIFPGAASSSLIIDDTNDIGIGTTAPSNSLHIRRTNGTALLRVEEASTTAAQRELFLLENNGGVRFAFLDTTTGQRIAMRNVNSQFQVDVNNDLSPELRLLASGNLEITGDLTANGTNYPSSRALKDNLAPVNPRDVLARLVSLPVATWTYKADAAQRRHIGTFSEDFHRAFDFIEGDGKLNTIDLHGVTMSAIQGLNALVEEKDVRIRELEERLAALEATLPPAVD